MPGAPHNPGSSGLLDPPSKVYSGVDTVPLIAQAKIAWQWAAGDAEGTQETWDNFLTYSAGASQIQSAYDWYTGNTARAKWRQREFMAGTLQVLKAIPEAFPGVGHLIGASHCCLGDRERGRAVLRRANRNCAVFGAGACLGATASVAGLGMVTDTLGQRAACTAASSIAGVLAGAWADRTVALPRPRAPPLSAGMQFDMAVLRLLDVLKAVSGMDLVFVFWPETVAQASVWVEPLNAGDIAHLATGMHLPGLDNINSGMLHSFVLLKTTKGRLLVTERLNDGHIVLGDVNTGNVEAWDQGNMVHDTLTLRDLERAQAGTYIFAVKHVAGGPTIASLEKFAAAQSNLGYDLFQANCQHYANGVLEFASGEGLTYLPNGDWLSLASLMWPSFPQIQTTTASFSQCVLFAGRQLPVKVGSELMAVAAPRRSDEDREQLEQSQQARLAPEQAAMGATQRSASA